MVSFLFTDADLEEPFKLIPNVLPTNNDGLHYVLSRTDKRKLPIDVANTGLIKEVHDCWSHGQACPRPMRTLKKFFMDGIYKQYKHSFKQEVC